MPPPEAPVGQVEVVDQDGLLVRPGGRIVRRGSIATGKLTTSKDPKVVPPENRDVKPHWHKVVMHQGWLLKQGGVGVGNIKSWIKRYFVLYKTSQGHFLVYYSDFTECPMYTAERNHRNLVDLAKATFIRPGSNKSENNPDVPPHSFDIVTTEREWTLCAESQENAQKWLKLLTRAVDEDVAILPDEELVFKVKPKMDPLGVLPVSDYSTSLKVSAHGISVTVPDTNSKDSSAEREVYFWVYTDFYKWSLLSQAGKLALLVNVFADASFSRRNEYIFRNKEAQRLATAIEFFIEKFMTLMHIRIETQEGAFDEEPVDQNNNNEETNELKAVSSGLHMMNAQEDQLDLLGLDLNDDQGGSVSPFGSSANLSPGLTSTPSAPVGEFQNSDPFGSTPFGEEPAPTPPTVPASQPPGNLENSPFGAADPFGADPFGFDNASPSPAVKVAPPLTPAQQQQHNQWLTAAMANNGGPLYSDGTLQIATQIEIRGSQGRVTFMYNNQSPAKLSNFVVSVEDASGLLRVQLSPFPDNGEIAGLHKTTQVLMAECMKPAYPGPKLKISYLDSLHGKRENTINLPIVVTTFNERLALSWEDYASRWHLLVGEGQEVQEILKPSFPIQTEQISSALVSPLKFGIVRQEPQPAPMVIYGAATLRTGAMNAAGEKISVGCLAKIELNPQANALRVTLRTVHPSASKAILETVKSLFI